jgi:hypothetical protein
MKTQTRISYVQLIQPDDFHSSLLIEETLQKKMKINYLGLIHINR